LCVSTNCLCDLSKDIHFIRQNEGR
jgi:hypothetical protein